jgi:hypothetical protein
MPDASEHPDPSKGKDYYQARAREEDRIFQSRMEWLKTVYDFYKHLMVVALASVAAVAALLGGVFKDTVSRNAPWEPKLLGGAAIVAFLITASGSIGGLNRARRTMLRLHEAEGEEEFEDLRERHGKIGLLSREQVWLVSMGSYFAGSIALIIFVVTALI